jgi:hypothetical protein
MTTEQWLSEAKSNKEALLSLLVNYHPRSGKFSIKERLPITAGGAEAACENVRRSIQLRDKDRPSPISEFQDALDKNDWIMINRLLNDAWFGVPESTSCWRIIGFKEAIALIEDLPEVDDVHPE